MSNKKNKKKRKNKQKFTFAIYCRVATKEQLGELEDNDSQVPVKN